MNTYTVTDEESAVDVKSVLLAEFEHCVTNQSGVVSQWAVWPCITTTHSSHLQTNLIRKRVNTKWECEWATEMRKQKLEIKQIDNKMWYPKKWKYTFWVYSLLEKDS